MTLFAAWAALTIAAAPAPQLGTALVQDGYSVRPPQGFRMVRMDLFTATRAGAVPPPGARDVPRYLSAALADGAGQDAAAMLISIVESPFSATPVSRESFAAATARHYAEELGMPLQLEGSNRVGGDAPRIEVVATLTQEGQQRRLLVAAMEGESRHAVVTFSAPAGRFAELEPSFKAALESFQSAAAESAASRDKGAMIAGALAVLLLAALSGSLYLRYFRRRPGDDEGAPPATEG